ncbi:MAG: sulfotransferase [Rhodospirillaceae bacterium]|nr:sulfotransferase [Rhodospirillaceae bacterium]
MFSSLLSMFGTLTEAHGKPPVLIGATGGSGTRALHSALSTAGLFMGERLNGAGDAMDFEPFLDDWINPILDTTRGLDYGPATLDRSALEDFKAALTTYRTEHPGGDALWGWKNPRSMYVLPLIHSVYPDLCFLHLVRDGRDMALSDNQNQARKHYAALFGQPVGDITPERSIKLWAKANNDVADWAERVLANRYLRIRFEDLCASPGSHLRSVFILLGLDGTSLEAAVAAALPSISKPASVNRWRALPEDDASQLTNLAKPVLERFGYAL